MTRYHISASGKAVVCNARLRPCPLGGEHYASKAEALMHAPASVPAVDSATGKFISREKMAENAEYAQFLREFELENGKSATSIYHSHAGVEVSRASMLAEIKRLEERDTASGMYYNADLIGDLKHDLYKADAAALREKKENFRAAYDSYRAEHGPAVRPNFRQLVADGEAKRVAAVAKREEEAKATHQKLSRVQGSKRLRNSQEEVAFSFGKRRSDPNGESAFFGEQVPAVAIGSALGELVTEGKESISDFFVDAGDSVRSLFHRG